MWRSASAVVMVFACCGFAAAADLPLPKDFRKPGPDTVAPPKPSPPRAKPAKPEPPAPESIQPEPAKPGVDRPAPANPNPADTPPPARRHIPLTPMHPGPVMPAPPPVPPTPEPPAPKPPAAKPPATEPPAVAPQTAPQPVPPQPLQSPAPDKPADDKSQLNDLQAPPLPPPSPRAGDGWWQAVVQKAPQCRSFSDGCRTCDPQFTCSNMPIACQPKEFVCTDPKDAGSKSSAPKAPAQ